MSTRKRQSVLQLQRDYESGGGKAVPLEKLVHAWSEIQKLEHTDGRSFFVLGGLHGAPFRGAGWGDVNFWGGYCNHGNVLFPTWHRMYVLAVENALRGVHGCDDVAMPFWDETDEYAQKNGLPRVFTDKEFEFKTDKVRERGAKIPNPLYSFTLPQNIPDNLAGRDASRRPLNYTKYKGYETVRYPLSGLVGTQKDQDETKKHNAQYAATATEYLNTNIRNWLKGAAIPGSNVYQQYLDCLKVPDYTTFSNTTSMTAWNENNAPPRVSLEGPHNAMHLAVGGFTFPGGQPADLIKGANGDMGENDTAALDPIFFFHHCFIDYLFWRWQVIHKKEDHLEIWPQYPGTNSVDMQGPAPGVLPNQWLDLDSPLDPFTDHHGKPYTSRNCVNIRRLGYEYGPGSLDTITPATSSEAGPGGVLRIGGINRADIRGSFTISAYTEIDNERHHLGTEAILSRWHVQGCMNCQTHLEATAYFPLPHKFLERRKAAESKIRVELLTHDAQTSSTTTMSFATERLETNSLNIHLQF